MELGSIPEHLTVVHLNDIDTSKMQLYRDDIYKRGVYTYYDDTVDQFVKIFKWPCNKHNYIYGELGLDLLHEGLISKFTQHLCPALSNVIVNDDNIITGYCTYRCPLAPWPGYYKQEPELQALPKVKEFTRRIEEYTIKYKVYHCDVTETNIVQLKNGQYSFIDLESILPVGLFDYYYKWFGTDRYENIIRQNTTQQDIKDIQHIINNKKFHTLETYCLKIPGINLKKK